MTKTLKDLFEVYKPKSPDEQKFVDKHVTIKHKDRNGNGDDVFNGNTKYIKRKEERHGYDVGDDEKVYEEVEEIEELSQKMVRAYRDKARDDKEEAEDEREFYKAHDDNTDAEDKKIRKRTAGIKMASRKIHGGAKVGVREEAEEIDELSRGTLASYVKKAGGTSMNSVGYHGMVRATSATHGDKEEYKKSKRVMDKRAQGIMRAADKLAKEEVEIEEKKLTPAEMKKREEIAKAMERENPGMDKSKKMAIATATAKRVAEEAEKLDELSTKKLLDYMDKASDARGHRKLPLKKVDNRYAGVAKASAKLDKRFAANKLTKEEIINRAIDKYMPELEDYVPMTQEEKLIAKLEHLPEAHILMLLGLYENLNEDNRTKMMSAVDTPEGINSLIDFAIQNRGE